MIVRFVDELSPELFELLLSPTNPGAAVEVEVEVETATRAPVVTTWLKVLLPLVVTTVVTTCWVLLRTDLDAKTTEESDRVDIIFREDLLSVDDLVVDVIDEADDGLCS